MSSRLNYGKTFLLGFGFFGLSVVWGVYNAFVPIFLSEKFGLSPIVVGFFMTLDNSRPSAHGPTDYARPWAAVFRFC